MKISINGNFLSNIKTNIGIDLDSVIKISIQSL